jgi:hypothetical protein
MSRAVLLERMAELVGAVRCSHPIRVAVDGPDAAGKTTLADELASVLRGRGRTVIRASIDGFHRPRAERYKRGPDSPDGYFQDSFDYEALRQELLDPFGLGGTRRYRRAGTGSLLEFSLSGTARTVAELGPLTGSQAGWSVLACSPDTDRAIVSQSGSQSEFLVIRLSSGQVVATYPGPASENGAGAASYDGSLVAIDGPSGITILNTVTGEQVANVVRRGNQVDGPVIASALAFSWDGTRLLVQSDIAQGGPSWIVEWATNTDLVNDQTSSVGLGEVAPLTSGATMFIQATYSPYGAYLLETNGTLQALPAADGDAAAPS